MKALYPSLDLEFTIEKAAEEFYNSDVKIEGADNEELGKVLSNVLQDSDLVITQGAGNIGQIVKKLAATEMSLAALKGES